MVNYSEYTNELKLQRKNNILRPKLFNGVPLLENIPKPNLSSTLTSIETEDLSNPKTRSGWGFWRK